MVAEIVLLALLAWVTVTDLRAHRIPNAVTYPGILLGLGLALSRSVLATDNAGLARIEFGDAWRGCLLLGGLMIVGFVLMGIGGGDVKLLAMIGAFLGPRDGFATLLWTFVLGAALAVVVLGMRVGWPTLFWLTLQQIGFLLRTGRAMTLTQEDRAAFRTRLFLAPSALAATLIVLYGNIPL